MLRTKTYRSGRPPAKVEKIETPAIGFEPIGEGGLAVAVDGGVHAEILSCGGPEGPQFWHGGIIAQRPGPVNEEFSGSGDFSD